MVAAAGAATLALALLLAGEPRMRADVFAWMPSGEVRRVSPSEGTFYQACVSPDGTSAIFAGGDVGPPRVWKADLATGEARPLTPPDSAAFVASWSWSGEEIVFSSDRDSGLPSIELQDTFDPRLYRPATSGPNRREFNLYVMDPDGGHVRRITSGPYRDLRATFSPDGERITFHSDRRPYAPLWTTRADGTGEPQPVRLEGEVRWDAFRPWYSADGSELWFFASVIGGDPRKRVLHVSAAGGQPKPLAWDDRGKTQGPFIDPLGPYLLLHTDRTGRSELWEVPLEDGQPRMLVPPGLDLPADRQVMHPTRSRTGVITFDASYRAGGALVRGLQDVRAGLSWRLRQVLGD